MENSERKSKRIRNSDELKRYILQMGCLWCECFELDHELKEVEPRDNPRHQAIASNPGF